ncbi:NADH:flavin oxidoreductase [Cumulibacter manganitolerans]|uniref:NADH:flavin oxidoreductase n=1 Tax=Cumulibacter manganitolerans TaxID=1884992 RepID=UPI001297670F|nr:NADH:flavin oxidoreductase [Cumulibacter manganitolerans]
MVFSDDLTFTSGRTMSNRFALAPLTNWQSNDDGTLSDDEFHWLVARARGGFGMTMTCAAYVSPEGKAFPGQLGISSDTHLPGLTRLAEAINAEGSMSVVQLHHGGRRASADISGHEAVAPWDDARFGARALTTGEVQRVVEDFTAAAVRAEQAGFDGVELHGAHGYLPCAFLDTKNNDRTDQYGGSYENRTRMIREMIDGATAATSAGFSVGVRLSGERHGVDLGEMKRLAGEVMADGRLDYLDMSLWDIAKLPHDDTQERKPLIEHFTGIPRGTTRLGVAGTVRDAAQARWALDRGADFVFVGRAAILHHDFSRRAMDDPAFAATPTPVTADYLRSEHLGEAFVEYLGTAWDDFVVR